MPQRGGESVKRGVGAPAKPAYRRGDRAAVGLILAGLTIMVTALVWLTYTTANGRGTTGRGPGSDQLIAARNDGLPAWVLFHSVTCPSCQEMEAIFEQLRPEFAGKVAFVDVDVNDPAQADLVREYGIAFIPTTFLIDRSGARVVSAVGTLSVDDLRSALRNLAESK